ncbi:Alpha/Beta hydrolase protein [Phaeosphaeriaceae sp. PMI808]|nr:Alpha/Beta hydrolase protein [Phaeosphaeriaceae sp. PMI808]
MTTLENESLELSDGRTLSYAIYGNLGPTSRATIVYMHGFPSSCFEGKLWESACTTRNVRLIVPDRPGSGRSTFQQNRTILDWPTDIIALVDKLEIASFYLLGVSGGSPYALACLKSIPKERILGVAVLSGLYPLKLGTEGLTSFFFDSVMGKAARNKDPKVLEDLMTKDIGATHPKDTKALRDPLNWLNYVAMTRESFSQGDRGAGWEARLNGSEWGFDLQQVESNVPLALWHGTRDISCTVAIAQKAKDLLGCELHLKEGEGHMSYVLSDGETILDARLRDTKVEHFING